MILAAGCALMKPQQADDPDPLLVNLDKLERRLNTIERVLENASLVGLTVQADELERRTSELRGRTETLEHEATSATERQRELYADLDIRIQNLERKLRDSVNQVSILGGDSLAPGQLPVPGGSDQDNYQASFEFLKEERYELAAMAFRQFLVSYPDSQLANNAQYWLAESYYGSQKFDIALVEFEKLINNYTTSRKASDALLKVGYCNYELKRWDAARYALVKVQTDYPDTTAAGLAKQRLKRMDSNSQ